MIQAMIEGGDSQVMLGTGEKFTNADANVIHVRSPKVTVSSNRKDRPTCLTFPRVPKTILVFSKVGRQSWFNFMIHTIMHTTLEHTSSVLVTMKT